MGKILILLCSQEKVKGRTRQTRSINNVVGLLFSLIQVLFIGRQNCNSVLLRILVCPLYRLRNRTVECFYRCTIFRCSLKMLKSFTDNQNRHDILQKYYIKYTRHIEVKENGKDENYTTQKDIESSVSVTKHFLLQP